jgi:hypothetical protein
MDDWTQIDPDLILVSDLIAEATPIEERRTGATSASCRGGRPHERNQRAAGRGASGLLPKAPTIRTLQHPAGCPPGDNSSAPELCAA